MRLTVLLILLSLFLINKKAFTQNPIDPNQPKPKPTFKERLYTGGNFAASFGSTTFLDISPIIGYRINNRLSAGTGITYIYYNVNNAYYKYNTSIYGGRAFSKFDIFESVFAYTEYEVLNSEIQDPLLRNISRKNIPAWYVGGGYQQKFNNNSGFLISLLYNLDENRYSIYQNPIIRAGFILGF